MIVLSFRDIGPGELSANEMTFGGLLVEFVHE